MERQIQTAPTLPFINNLAPLEDRIGGRRTAPNKECTGEFYIPAITPATNKQNRKLSQLLKLLYRATNGELSPDSSELLARKDESDSAGKQSFDKNWQELMRRIGNRIF
jgi:hypothetical protein